MVTATVPTLDLEEEMLSPEALQYAPLEAKLKEWQLPYTVEREFPIEDVRVVPASQIRSLSTIAPAARVEEYAMQMRNGALFPPILVRKPGNILIDGNTRLAAAKRIGRKTFPAIVVDTKTEDMHKILAAAVNQMGGERLEAADAHEAALLMMQAGYPDGAVARELGRDLSQVRRWRQQREVLERAEGYGLSEQAALIPRSSLGRLLEIRLEDPFKEMTRLFADVRPNEKQAKEMASQVVQASSESAAMKVIEDLREELAPAGPPPHVATRSELPLTRAAIGRLVKYEGRPSAAFDPRKIDEELERWDRVRRISEEILEAIRAVEREAVN